MSLFVRLVIMVTLFITINKNFDLVLEPVCLKENPATDSILEPSQWLWSQDQWFSYLFLPHPILTSGEQIKRLIFKVLIMEAVESWYRENNGKRKNLEACMWVLWTWISGWVRWWFWLGLWYGFRLCLISICDLGLCLCLVSVSFLYFFHLCCCDLGLSFWLLDLIWEEHEEQVVMFLVAGVFFFLIKIE